MGQFFLGPFALFPERSHSLAKTLPDRICILHPHYNRRRLRFRLRSAVGRSIVSYTMHSQPFCRLLLSCLAIIGCAFAQANTKAQVTPQKATHESKVLSPEELFRRLSQSVVVVEALDAHDTVLSRALDGFVGFVRIRPTVWSVLLKTVYPAWMPIEGGSTEEFHWRWLLSG